MNSEEFYRPFITKFKEWVAYSENCPKGNYKVHFKEYDEFRAANDRDCVLIGGNLYADTIFSLWTPLKQTIIRLNAKEAIQQVGNIGSKYLFCKSLLVGDNLSKLLPEDNSVVKELRELFVIGLERCNVMILPERWLNPKRGKNPYRDYVPHFLYELFPGGDFASVFDSEEELVKWIKKEKLHMFFKDGIISRDSIIDLSGSGDVKCSFAPFCEKEQCQMLHNYRMILQLRERCV